MKRNIWIGIGIAVVVALAIVLIVTQTKKELNEIKIGAALPLTGEGALYGQAAKNAIDLAVSQINETGGIHGKKVKVLYEDTKLSPQEATIAVTKLITINKVPLIIGPMASSAVEAVMPICEKNKVIVVSPSATDHKLTGKSRYFFRTIVNDVYEGEVMARFVYEKLGLRKLAIFYVQSAGPQGVSEALVDNFRKLGGEIIITERCEQEATDFRTQLTKINSSNADVLFFAGFAKETGRMLRQAKEIGFKKQILGHQTAEAPEVRELAGDAANGIIFASSQFGPETSPTIESFYEAYKSKYNNEPQNYAANTYDALNIVATAIQKYGYKSGNIIKGLYETKNYQGVSGKITIDKNGDTIGPMVIKEIENGQVVPYAE